MSLAWMRTPQHVTTTSEAVDEERKKAAAQAAYEAYRRAEFATTNHPDPVVRAAPPPLQMWRPSVDTSSPAIGVSSPVQPTQTIARVAQPVQPYAADLPFVASSHAPEPERVYNAPRRPMEPLVQAQGYGPNPAPVAFTPPVSMGNLAAPFVGLYDAWRERNSAPAVAPPQAPQPEQEGTSWMDVMKRGAEITMPLWGGMAARTGLLGPRLQEQNWRNPALSEYWNDAPGGAYSQGEVAQRNREAQEAGALAPDMDPEASARVGLPPGMGGDRLNQWLWDKFEPLRAGELGQELRSGVNRIFDQGSRNASSLPIVDYAQATMSGLPPTENLSGKGPSLGQLGSSFGGVFSENIPRSAAYRQEHNIATPPDPYRNGLLQAPVTAVQDSWSRVVDKYRTYGEQVDRINQLPPELRQDARLILGGTHLGGARSIQPAFDELQMQPQLIQEAATRRDEAQVKGDGMMAAVWGREYNRLTNRTAVDIANDNLNVWADMFGQMFVDPTELVAPALGVLGLTKEARAAAAAWKTYNMTPTEAGTELARVYPRMAAQMSALAGGQKIGYLDNIMLQAERGKWGEVLNELLGVTARTPESKAALDSETIFNAAVPVLKEARSGEQAHAILDLMTTPEGRQQMLDPRWWYEKGMNPVGPGIVGNKTVSATYPILDSVRDTVLGMESLKAPKYNPADVISELTGIVYGQARQAYRVGGTVGLPYGAAKVTAELLEDGRGGLRYLDKKGKLLGKGVRPTFADARTYATEINKNARTPKTFQKATLDVASLPADVQRTIMSHLWLGLRPSNWIQNALSGSFMLLNGDSQTFRHMDDLMEELARPFGGNIDNWRNQERLTGKSLVEGVQQGPQSQFGKMTSWYTRTPLGKLSQGGLEKAYGPTGVQAFGHTIIPSEQNLFLRATAVPELRARNRQFKEMGSFLEQRFREIGASPEQAKALSSQFVQMAPNGSQSIRDGFRRLANSMTLRNTLSTLNIPDELIPGPIRANIERVLEAGDGSTPQGLQAMRDAIEHEITSAKVAHAWVMDQETLRPIDNLREGVDVAEGAQATLHRMGLNAGLSPEQALAESEAVGRAMQQAHTAALNAVKDEAKGMPNTDDTWSVMLDFATDIHERRKAVRRAVDELGDIAAEATGPERSRLWAEKWQGTKQLYGEYAAQLPQVADEYRHKLMSVYNGEPYQSQNTFNRWLEEYLAWDERHYQEIIRRTAGMGAGAENKELWHELMAVNRQAVDGSAAELFEVFKRYPSLENFDLLVDSLNWMHNKGASVALELEALRKPGQAFDSVAYKQIRDAKWTEYFRVLVPDRFKGMAKAMVQNAIDDEPKVADEFDEALNAAQQVAPAATNGVNASAAAYAKTVGAPEGTSVVPKMVGKRQMYVVNEPGKEPVTLTFENMQKRFGSKKPKVKAPPTPVASPKVEQVMAEVEAAVAARPQRPYFTPTVERLPITGAEKPAYDYGPAAERGLRLEGPAYNPNQLPAPEKRPYTPPTLTNRSRIGPSEGEPIQLPGPSAAPEAPLPDVTPPVEPVAPSVPDVDIRALASRIGVGTVTEKGKPHDRHLINWINKHVPDVKIRRVDDLTPEQRVSVADALRARFAQMNPGKVTQVEDAQALVRSLEAGMSDLDKATSEIFERMVSEGRERGQGTYGEARKLAQEQMAQPPAPVAEAVQAEPNLDPYMQDVAESWARSTGPEAYRARVALGGQMIPGLHRGGDLEDAGVIYYMLQKGEVPQKEWDDFVWRMWDENRISDKPAFLQRYPLESRPAPVAPPAPVEKPLSEVEQYIADRAGRNEYAQPAEAAPITPSPNAKFTPVASLGVRKKVWEGSRLEPGNIVSDGHSAFLMDEVLPNKRKLAEALAGKEAVQVRRLISQDQANFIIPPSNPDPLNKLMLLGVDPSAEKRGRAEAIAFLIKKGQGDSVAVDAHKFRLMQEVTGANEFYQKAPNGPVFMYRDRTPVATLMPIAVNERTADVATRAGLTPGSTDFYGGVPVLPARGGGALWEPLLKQIQSWRRTGNMDHGWVQDIPPHMISSLEEARRAILDNLPQLIKGTPNYLSPAQRLRVVDAVDGILPRYENSLGAAAEVGRRMGTWAMLNFNDRRHFDSLIAAVVPYHYFWSRMGARMAQVALTRPDLVNVYFEAQRAIERENQQTFGDLGYVPGRMEGTLPIPGTDYRPNVAKLLRAGIPVNQYIAPNPYAEVADDATGIEKWGQQLMQRTPSPFLGYRIAYSMWQDAHDPLPNGEKRTDQYTLSDFVWPYRTLTDAYHAATGQRKPDWMPEGPGWMSGEDKWHPGRIRDAIAQIGLEKKLPDYLVSMAQDIAIQKQTGEQALPEQPKEALALYAEAVSRAGKDRLISGVTSHLGLQTQTLRPSEMASRQLSTDRRALGYGEGENIGGSHAAQKTFDEDTDNQVFPRYQVDYNAEHERPGLGAVDRAYNTEQSAIYDKYGPQSSPLWDQAATIKTQMDAAAEGKQWDTYYALKPERQALIDQANAIGDRQDAELAALKEKYPSYQPSTDAPGSVDYYKNYNPDELNTAAIRNAEGTAKDKYASIKPGDYPAEGTSEEKGTWVQADAAYELAVLEETQRILATNPNSMVAGRETGGSAIEDAAGRLGVSPTGVPEKPAEAVTRLEGEIAKAEEKVGTAVGKSVGTGKGGAGGAGKTDSDGRPWADYWDEYQGLGSDYAAKAAYLKSHPEFAAYYKSKYYKDKSAWWESYTGDSTAGGSTYARSYSYGGGGGGGGGYDENNYGAGGPSQQFYTYAIRPMQPGPQRAFEPAEYRSPYENGMSMAQIAQMLGPRPNWRLRD